MTYLIDYLESTAKPLVLAQTRPRPLIERSQDSLYALLLPNIGKCNPSAWNEFVC